MNNEPLITVATDVRQKAQQAEADAARFTAIDHRAVDIRQKLHQAYVDSERFLRVIP